MLFGIPLGLYFSLSYTRNFDSDREVEKVDKQRKEEKSIRERWGKAEEAEGPREGRTSLLPPPPQHWKTGWSCNVCLQHVAQHTAEQLDHALAVSAQPRPLNLTSVQLRKPSCPSAAAARPPACSETPSLGSGPQHQFSLPFCAREGRKLIMCRQPSLSRNPWQLAWGRDMWLL